MLAALAVLAASPVLAGKNVVSAARRRHAQQVMSAEDRQSVGVGVGVACHLTATVTPSLVLANNHASGGHVLTHVYDGANYNMANHQNRGQSTKSLFVDRAQATFYLGLAGMAASVGGIQNTVASRAAVTALMLQATQRRQAEGLAGAAQRSDIPDDRKRAVLVDPDCANNVAVTMALASNLRVYCCAAQHANGYCTSWDIVMAPYVRYEFDTSDGAGGHTTMHLHTMYPCQDVGCAPCHGSNMPANPVAVRQTPAFLIDN